MKKLLQISLIIFIIFMVLAPNFSQATGVNMNLTANLPTGNTASDNTAIDDNTNTVEEPEDSPASDRLLPTNTNNSTSVSTLDQLPESGLGLNNIINIILIVIGVLLILLGIAILIRLKK